VTLEYKTPAGEWTKVPVTHVPDEVDSFAFVLSADIHRRHLTAEQKHELIAKVIEAQPEKSDRQIAKQVRVDHKTVAAVRAKMVDVGRIPHVPTRTDTKGRKQPATKKKRRDVDDFLDEKRQRKAAREALANAGEMERAAKRMTAVCERIAAGEPDGERPKALVLYMMRLDQMAALSKECVALLDEGYRQAGGGQSQQPG
jgi:hypothetical protein